jgi:hypothetical protein
MRKPCRLRKRPPGQAALQSRWVGGWEREVIAAKQIQRNKRFAA